MTREDNKEVRNVTRKHQQLQIVELPELIWTTSHKGSNRFHLNLRKRFLRFLMLILGHFISHLQSQNVSRKVFVHLFLYWDKCTETSWALLNLKVFLSYKNFDKYLSFSTFNFFTNYSKYRKTVSRHKDTEWVWAGFYYISMYCFIARLLYRGTLSNQLVFPTLISPLSEFNSKHFNQLR